MTYINGNVYSGPTPTAPLDKFAHDDCLPASEFEPIIINGKPTDETHQKWPWHWHPVYGAPEPCYVCGKPVK